MTWIYSCGLGPSLDVDEDSKWSVVKDLLVEVEDVVVKDLFVLKLGTLWPRKMTKDLFLVE